MLIVSFISQIVSTSEAYLCVSIFFDGGGVKGGRSWTASHKGRFSPVFFLER
jgi:hypothetical protein